MNVQYEKCIRILRLIKITVSSITFYMYYIIFWMQKKTKYGHLILKLKRQLYMFINNKCIINVYIISNFNSILFTHYCTLLLDLHFIYLNQFLLFIYYN